MFQDVNVGRAAALAAPGHRATFPERGRFRRAATTNSLLDAEMSKLFAVLFGALFALTAAYAADDVKKDDKKAEATKVEPAKVGAKTESAPPQAQQAETKKDGAQKQEAKKDEAKK